jgi:hypothetical protein
MFDPVCLDVLPMGSKALWRGPAKSPKSNSVADRGNPAFEPGSCGKIADNLHGLNKE